MAAFSFDLQAVLEQRKRLQDLCQREVAELQTAMTALEKQLTELNDGVRAETEDMRRGNLLGNIDLAYWTAHRRFTIAMQQKATLIMQELAGEKVKLDAARQRLLAAVVQYKAIEKLRERQAAHWQQARSRRETRDLDEIYNRADAGRR